MASIARRTGGKTDLTAAAGDTTDPADLAQTRAHGATHGETHEAHGHARTSEDEVAVLHTPAALSRA
jgi:hypothetical protein